MHTYDCTFYGLHKWHNALFEKFGWMIMAKEHNHEFKLLDYLDGIQRIQTCITPLHI